ncbi:MAG TPA: ABC transporter substrate-binding protein [Chloroflexia bacterium]
MNKKSMITGWWRMGALLLLIGMVLAACDSGTPATPTNPAPANTTMSEAVATGTTTAGAAAPTNTIPEAAPTNTTGVEETGTGPRLNKDVSGEVEFWHHWSSPVRRNAIRRVIAACAVELPNINVTEVARPFGEVWTANATAVAESSGMPDVLVSDRPKLPQDAANRIYTDLQEWATRDGVTGDQFWPFTWEQTLYQGHTYGIPFETDVRVLFYNKVAFTEAGLDPANPPKTWAELEAAADKLDKRNADGTWARIAFLPLLGNISPEVLGYTNGVEWIKEDGTFNINTPEAAETLVWYKKWVDRYGGWESVETFRTGFQPAPNDAFMSGKVAMIVDVNGYASQLNFFNPQVEKGDGSGRTRLDWGVSDIPYNKQKASFSGGFSFSIPRGADGAEAAWEFIKCATGKEGAASWSRDTYAMAANIEAAQDPVLGSDPTWKFFLSAMEYSRSGIYHEDYPSWGEQLTQRYERLWKGEISPEQLLQEAEQAIKDQIGQ